LLNRRNHRKTLVIDDWVAYFGGMNLIDPLECQFGQNAIRSSAAGWRDVHVRLVGPEVAEVAESFDRSWRRELHQRTRRRWRPYRRGVLPAAVREGIRFFDSGPGFKQSRAARVFARLMRTARRDIVLSMAYFIPAGRVLRELLRARKRGVRVRAVVPSDNDVKLVQFALRHLYVKLLRRGIEIYERQECMLHSKAMVVDDAWSVVGSCNLDPRSLELNYEFLAVIRSRPFALELLKICENEIAHSRRVTLDQCNGRTWRQRLVDRLAYSLRAWL
jgi:cardiolipin synthase